MSKYNIYMPCPKCVHDNNNYYSEEWIHGGKCGGNLLIDENAYVTCSKCGKKAHVSRMRISCDSHKHLYVKSSKKEIGSAVTIAGIGTNSGSLQWIKKFLSNL